MDLRDGINPKQSVFLPLFIKYKKEKHFGFSFFYDDCFQYVFLLSNASGEAADCLSYVHDMVSDTLGVGGEGEILRSDVS